MPQTLEPVPAGTRTLVITHGAYRAELSTLGAGLRALTFEGRPLVETYPDGEIPPLSSGLVLAPWPNRTEDGRFDYDGATHQLTITEPERNNAIHGLVLGKVWEEVEHTADSLILGTTITPEEGWPWTIVLRATYVLDDGGLEATFEATTSEQSPVPFAFGWHTYLNAQGAPLEDCRLTVGIDKHLPLDSKRNLPCGPLESDELTSHLAKGLGLSECLLDDCFYASSAATALLVDAHGNGVALSCSANLPWFQIFTPDEAIGLPFPGKERGRAIAVEPMSAPPNALVTGEYLADLYEGAQRYEVYITAVTARDKQ